MKVLNLWNGKKYELSLVLSRDKLLKTFVKRLITPKRIGRCWRNHLDNYYSDQLKWNKILNIFGIKYDLVKLEFIVRNNINVNL